MIPPTNSRAISAQPDPLRLVGALVDDRLHDPATLVNRAWPSDGEGELEAVEPGVAKATPVDIVQAPGDF